ncbi:hypothetical protein [Methylocystis hirsuta]|uniref:hypothetical protein n=1 Tax=Methylocystis hirsuta TaxID=369798 RepID=UPI001AEC78F1|nr:hypothetical protein [Methylocystis hirsuta]
MLKELTIDQARFIAILAKAARVQRDELLGNVAEKDLDAVQPGRGEHNPTAAFGFEPVPAGAPLISALRDAIATLSAAARCELYALAWWAFPIQFPESGSRRSSSGDAMCR